MSTTHTITDARWSDRGYELMIHTPWGEDRKLTIITARLEQFKNKAEMLAYIQSCVTKWSNTNSVKASVDSMSLVGEVVSEKAKEIVTP